MAWGEEDTMHRVDILRILEKVLAAALKQRRKEFTEAELLYDQALVIERRLPYDEPPLLAFSVDLLAGDNFLRLSSFDSAKLLFEHNLASFPNNAWALHGLGAACEGTLDNACKKDAQERFRIAWQRADADLLSPVEARTRPSAASEPCGNETSSPSFFASSAKVLLFFAFCAFLWQVLLRRVYFRMVSMVSSCRIFRCFRGPASRRPNRSPAVAFTALWKKKSRSDEEHFAEGPEITV